MVKPRHLGLFLAVLLLGVLVSCNTGSVPEVSEFSSQAVQGRYIVVLKPEFAPGGHAANQARAAEIARQHGLSPDKLYGSALFGFAAEIPAGRLNGLRNDPRVDFIEADQIAHIMAQEIPTGVKRIFADTNANLDIDGSDDYRIDVDVAVIDTGIDLQHTDLHVVQSTDCSGGSPLSGSCKSGGDDDNGHGTHVAGTIGALDNGYGVVGVAPGARLWGVKVLRADGSGYMSWIVAGIDYVTANAADVEVANMSLGCECSSDAMNKAITNSVAKGIVYAVAAGNSDMDAATFSPANHPDVITVSALADFDGASGALGSPTCRTDEDDTLANFSNFGTMVEIAAPGVCILSTWHDGGYNTISGTSMASPHVAGAAALLASSTNPQNKTDVENIRTKLINNGNLNWTDDSGDGIKERLLDVSNTTVFNPKKVAGSGGGGGDTGGETISLTASGYKAKGFQTVDLSWGPVTSTSVDVYRDGVVIVTTSNDGTYTDNIGIKGGGTYIYKVCEAGTATCSNEATVVF